MAARRTSVNWTAKLNNTKDLPKYFDSSNDKFSRKFGEGRFVIPAPLEVEGHTVIQKGKRFLVVDFQNKSIVPKPK